MTDHDPFGPPSGQDSFGAAEDDKTVQYARSTPAPTDDDGKTVRIGPGRATPAPGLRTSDDGDGETVRYRQDGPAAPVWKTTGRPDYVDAPPPASSSPTGQPHQPGESPSWFPATPGQQPPPSSGRKWWFIGGGAVAALVVIAAIVAVLVLNSGGDEPQATAPADPSSSSAEAPPPAPSNAPTTTDEPAAPGLAGLLETADELSTRMESAGMTAGPILTDPVSGTTVDPANCTSVWTPADATAYAASGFTGLAAQVVQDPAPIAHQVNQAVASFPDEQTAKAFYDKVVADWAGCKYTTLDVSGTENVTAKTGVFADTDGTANMLILVDAKGGGDGVQCERAITSRVNVVVDVRACSKSVGSAGWTIARDIGQKVTGQR